MDIAISLWKIVKSDEPNASYWHASSENGPVNAYAEAFGFYMSFREINWRATFLRRGLSLDDYRISAQRLVADRVLFNRRVGIQNPNAEPTTVEFWHDKRALDSATLQGDVLTFEQKKLVLGGTQLLEQTWFQMERPVDLISMNREIGKQFHVFVSSDLKPFSEAVPAHLRERFEHEFVKGVRNLGHFAVAEVHDLPF